MKNNYTREEIVSMCVAEAKKNVTQIADHPAKAHINSIGGVENDPIFIGIVDDAFDSVIFDKKSRAIKTVETDDGAKNSKKSRGAKAVNAVEVDENSFTARERRVIIVHVAHAYADAILRQVRK